jgi:hypothetical protein
MPVFKALKRHLRRGTLGDAVRARFGVIPESARVHWHGARNEREGVRALVKWARGRVADTRGGWVLSLGDDEAFHRQLNSRLKQDGVSFKASASEQVESWTDREAGGLCGIVCGYPDARRATLAARMLAKHPVLATAGFQYVAGLDGAYEAFSRLDEYADTFFVSPVLVDDPTPYAIYQESLKLFEQKCGLRDFLDLYQLLKSINHQAVPGDIAEFGSYRGHSGWLIARTLEVLGGPARRVYLFDTFESFPTESLGVDQFWSGTHHTDFKQVSDKLSGFSNVTLVKGDFTETLGNSGLQTAALAYIDCDSYRATRFLLDALPPRLPSGGIMVCEDYGHPALLGNRVAVHECLAARDGYFQFFSQFSGLYIAVKR